MTSDHGPPTDEFITVAKTGAIAENRGGTFVVGGKLVAVFFAEGKYFAIDDICPHMGASLGAGEVCEGIVTCPWHAWRFNITDGAWRDNPKLKVNRYEIRVLGDEIQVRVPATIRPPDRPAPDRPGPDRPTPA